MKQVTKNKSRITRAIFGLLLAVCLSLCIFAGLNVHEVKAADEPAPTTNIVYEKNDDKYKITPLAGYEDGAVDGIFKFTVKVDLTDKYTTSRSHDYKYQISDGEEYQIPAIEKAKEEGKSFYVKGGVLIKVGKVGETDGKKFAIVMPLMTTIGGKTDAEYEYEITGITEAKEIRVEGIKNLSDTFSVTLAGLGIGIAGVFVVLAVFYLALKLLMLRTDRATKREAAESEE